MTRGRSRRPRLGQNFLVRASAARRIVELLELGPSETVLEIGPGRGALTELLVESPAHVVAVELDPKLAGALQERFGPERLLVLRQDILDVKLAAVCDQVAAERLVVVGNLPYGISKPVAMKLVRERSSVDRAVLMFQREVAQRLTSSPGAKSYGPLGVFAGAAYDIRREFDLSPASFRPPPKVMSSVTRWRRLPSGLSSEGLVRLRACLAVCFTRRRKTLRNNLRSRLGNDQNTERLLQAAGVDGSRRAESLSREEFVRLAVELAAATDRGDALL